MADQWVSPPMQIGTSPYIEMQILSHKGETKESKPFTSWLFKEGVAVQDVLNGMEKLVSEVDVVKSFEWGQDIESHEMLRQGFTHAFLMTFDKKEDYTAFTSHPSHIEFSATFVAAIDKFVVLDFPSVVAKSPA
ncbi:hypothetical protein V6N11_002448 [Hibiscus sabdariffa]|uniref:Stress-response A/B barrel domain-containing protein n=1 Tax=Hibiscus sabdariffa TaxID=183260 RepID=A0ABR2SAX5_9ROSI